MLHFFRKIRQSLLSKSKAGNPALPAGRYLKYAVGEIILVVIGILLALQINNWNEQKKNTAQALKHLETIRLNLADDIKQADSLLRETQTTITYTTTFLNQFKTLLPPSNEMQLYLIYLMYERNIEVNESGFTSLVNSNGTSYIDERLENKLMGYYRHIEQLKSRENNANTEIKSMFEPYVKNNYYWIYNKDNPWHRQAALYKDDPRPVNIDLESIIHDKRLEIMVNHRKYQSELLADFYAAAIEKARDILDEIENIRGGSADAP